MIGRGSRLTVMCPWKQDDSSPGRKSKKRKMWHEREKKRERQKEAERTKNLISAAREERGRELLKVI